MCTNQYKKIARKINKNNQTDFFVYKFDDLAFAVNFTFISIYDCVAF